MQCICVAYTESINKEAAIILIISIWYMTNESEKKLCSMKWLMKKISYVHLNTLISYLQII